MQTHLYGRKYHADLEKQLLNASGLFTQHIHNVKWQKGEQPFSQRKKSFIYNIPV